MAPPPPLWGSASHRVDRALMARGRHSSFDQRVNKLVLSLPLPAPTILGRNEEASAPAPPHRNGSSQINKDQCGRVALAVVVGRRSKGSRQVVHSGGSLTSRAHPPTESSLQYQCFLCNFCADTVHGALHALIIYFEQQQQQYINNISIPYIQYTSFCDTSYVKQFKFG